VTRGAVPAAGGHGPWLSAAGQGYAATSTRHTESPAGVEKETLSPPLRGGEDSTGSSVRTLTWVVPVRGLATGRLSGRVGCSSSCSTYGVPALADEAIE